MRWPQELASGRSKVEEPHAFTPRQVPILDHYSPAGVVKKVDANQKPEAVWDLIDAALPK